MPVEFCSGDLFATPELSAFAHGCNCAGAMGKGIAIAFKERWPGMFDEYRQRCKDGDFQPGDVFVWRQDGNHVYNLGTQQSWRSKATLPAVRKALETMLELAAEDEVREIALPRIGAGLGGLPWPEVRALLEEIAQSSPIRLLVCEEFVEGRPLR